MGHRSVSLRDIHGPWSYPPSLLSVHHEIKVLLHQCPHGHDVLLRHVKSSNQSLNPDSESQKRPFFLWIVCVWYFGSSKRVQKVTKRENWWQRGWVIAVTESDHVLLKPENLFLEGIWKCLEKQASKRLDVGLERFWMLQKCGRWEQYAYRCEGQSYRNGKWCLPEPRER